MAFKAPYVYTVEAVAFINPQPAQLAGAIRSAAVLGRTAAANPPISIYGAPLNPSAAPFPGYIDALAVRGIKTILPRPTYRFWPRHL